MTLAQPSLPSLDDRTPRRHTRQRSTARAVFHALQPTLKGREAQVLRCLEAWQDRYHTCPTALELLAFMRESGEQVFDVNSLRPRIFYLVKKGLVDAHAKRRCVVSGKTVLTWGVASR